MARPQSVPLRGTNHKHMKLVLPILLIAVVIAGCQVVIGGKGDSGSSGPKITISGRAYQQTSDNTIVPAGGSTVTAEYTDPNKRIYVGLMSKAMPVTVQAKVKSDGSYEIPDIPPGVQVKVTITNPDTSEHTETITASGTEVHSSAILKGRGKKTGIIKKLQETALNTFDDTLMPACQVTIPSNAVSADVYNVKLTTTHQPENLQQLPDGYAFIAGAEFKTSSKTLFASGKEATPYIILPQSVNAEDLSSADIRLMEFIDNNWVISGTGKGKVHTSGDWNGYLGPDDTTPAKLKGVHPWAWVVSQSATAPAQISGTVRNTSGAPVKGVFVFGGGSKAHTKSDGTYTLRNIAVIKPNTLIPLDAVADGYEPASQFIALSPGSVVTNVNFTLSSVTQLGEVYGRVTNSADSTPIYGAMVTLSSDPYIRGMKYDNKNTPTNLTDDTFYVIPPPGVTINQYKWALVLPTGTKFTSGLENGSEVILNQLATEATNAGYALGVGAYRVELEVNYSGGKKVTVSGGFLLKQTGLYFYIADVKLPISLQDQLVLKAVTDVQGNYRFVNLPTGEGFVASARADGFIASNAVGISGLSPGEKRQQDFALAPVSSDPEPPSQPTNVTGTAQSTYSILLTWSASTDNVGIDYYRVYRDGIEVGKTTATSYVDSGLQPATQYTYIIGAFDKANNSALSNSVSVWTQGVVVDTTPPSTPTNLTAVTFSTSQINLSWFASSDNIAVTGYKLYSSTDGITYALRSTLNATTSCSDLGLSAATAYWYKVSAFDAAGNNSGYSNVVSATTQAAPDIEPPSTPTGLAATAVSSGQIDLAWTASTDTGGSGLAGYKVYQSTNGITYALRSTLNATTSYNDSGLSASTTYWYKVASYDNAGNTSGQSSPASATTFAFIDTEAPTSPTNLGTSVVTATWISLTWSPSTDNVGVTGYKVFRNAVYINSSAGTNYTDYGLSPSTPYSYTVQAYDAAGNLSALSAALNTATVADDAPPSAPTALTATAITSSMISLAWTGSTDNVGVTGYKVYRSPEGITYTLISTLSSVLSYTDTGLSGSTSYWYKVAAYDAANNISADSNVVSATTPAGVDTTAPSVPSGLFAGPNGPTAMTVTWTASTDTGGSGMAGYYVYRNGAFISSLSSTVYIDGGLAPATEYGYSVAAYDNAGNISAQCAVVSGTTFADTTAPTVPTGLTGTAVSTSQINLWWNASTDDVGVTGYKLYSSTDGITYALRSTLYATNYSDTGLSASTTYWYKVSAYDGANNESGQSSAISATTQSAGNALVGWWKFDETSGTLATDSSGYGNNGTVYGATWSGGALSFDGVDDYVPVGDLNINNDFTIQAWVKPNNTNKYLYIFMGGDMSLDGYWSIAFDIADDDNNGSCYLGAGVQYGTTQYPGIIVNDVVPENQWSFVTFSKVGTNGYVYVNGNLAGSTTSFPTLLNNVSMYTIGAKVNAVESSSFYGSIDDVRIYNYARTSEQILAEYNEYWNSRPIAYISNQGGTYNIYLMKTDGTGGVPLTSDSAGSYSPMWSPDGTKIAYHKPSSTYNDCNDVWVMNRDGSNKKLVRSGTNSRDGSILGWLPDGSGILYNRSPGYSYATAYRVNLDGSNDVLFVDPAVVAGKNELCAISLSRDGKQVVWSAQDGSWSPTLDLFKAPVTPTSWTVDTTNIVRLTNDGLLDSFYGPYVWNNNGSKILYHHVTGGNGYDNNLMEIYVMNADGTGVTRLTNNSAQDNNPQWTPDEKIIFESNRNGNSDIFIMNSDGTGVTQLTSGSAAENSPDWRRANLLAHWKFDEGTGGIANDVSGNNNHGTLYGGPTWSAGALSFDGVDDYVDCGNINAANPGLSGSLTASAWVKTSDVSGDILTKYGWAGSTPAWNLDIRSGKF
ncbi:MAG: fibronectin type III domain-containing protein, partial [Planctomycetota bacterium]